MPNYKPRKRNLYQPNQPQAFKLSRSKIDLFTQCPRCFYLDVKNGLKRPSGPPFLLNSAVDQLLKQEFDTHRVKGKKHPLMETYGIDALPAEHQDLDKWRHNFTGIQYHHPKTNFLLYGALDDLWINPKGEYHVVDYKATAKNQPAETHQDLWPGFLKQIEIYQWLLKKLGHQVSPTGYFVNCNGKKDLKAFDKKLEFDVTIIPCKGRTDWVEPVIIDIKKTLDQNQLPSPGEGCDFCEYRKLVYVKEKI